MKAKLFMYAAVSVAVLAGLLVVKQEAVAGSPCHVVTSKHHVAVAAYTPTYNYNQFVPVVQTVAVVPDFFYSSANYARDEALLEALKLLRESRSNNASKGEEKRTSSVDEEFTALLEGVPEIGDKAVSKSNSNSSLQSIADSKCVRCHNSSSGKRMDLSDLSMLSANARKQVEEEIADDVMPPQRAGGKLSKEEKRLFREWAYQTK